MALESWKIRFLSEGNGFAKWNEVLKRNLIRKDWKQNRKIIRVFFTDIMFARNDGRPIEHSNRNNVKHDSFHFFSI